MAKFPLRVRSKIAMRVCSVDRQRFNEAVSAKHYECPPSTVSGSARIFGEDDLLTLFVFGRLLDFGILPRTAGRLACAFKNGLRDRDGKRYDTMTLVRGQMGDVFTGTYNPEKPYYGGIGYTVFKIDFPVKDIWDDIIAPKVEYERTILGVEGEDD